MLTIPYCKVTLINGQLFEGKVIKQKSGEYINIIDYNGNDYTFNYDDINYLEPSQKVITI
jgi:hypothetical protein